MILSSSFAISFNSIDDVDFGAVIGTDVGSACADTDADLALVAADAALDTATLCFGCCVIFILTNGRMDEWTNGR